MPTTTTTDLTSKRLNGDAVRPIAVCAQCGRRGERYIDPVEYTVEVIHQFEESRIGKGHGSIHVTDACQYRWDGVTGR